MSNRLFNDDEFDSLFATQSKLMDKQFTAVEKTVKRGFFVVFIVWLIGLAVSLGVLGGLIYVAYHFISKAW